MTPTNSNGFVVFDKSAVTAFRRNISSEMRSLKQLGRFTFFDMDFQPKWAFDYNEDPSAASFEVYRYFTGEGNDIIFKKHTFQTGTDKNPEVAYEVFDLQNGTHKFEFKLHKDQYLLDVVDFKFEPDQMIVSPRSTNTTRTGFFIRTASPVMPSLCSIERTAPRFRSIISNGTSFRISKRSTAVARLPITAACIFTILRDFPMAIRW